jgi:hypothetical protein
MTMHSRPVRIATALLAALMACGGDPAPTDDGSGPVDAAPDEDDGDGAADASADAGASCGRDIRASEDLASASSVLADDTFVYVSTRMEGEQRIWRVRIDDGAAELLAGVTGTDGNRRLLADGDDLYVSGEPVDAAPGGIFRVSKTGGEPERITDDPVRQMAIDETHVYWFTSALGQTPPQAIKRRARSGGDEEILVQGESEIGPDARIAVTGGDLYWNQGAILRRQPAAGGDPEVFGTIEDPDAPNRRCGRCVDAMVVGPDGRLYWYGAGVERTLFYRTELDAYEPELFSADQPFAVYLAHAIAVQGDHIYWATSSGGIGRAPVAGGDAVTVQASGVQAFYPTAAGLYAVSFLGDLRLIPLEGCPD